MLTQVFKAMLGSKCTIRVSWVTFWGLSVFVNMTFFTFW